MKTNDHKPRILPPAQYGGTRPRRRVITKVRLTAPIRTGFLLAFGMCLFWIIVAVGFAMFGTFTLPVLP